MESQPLVVRNGKAVRDTQVVGLQAQQARHQGPVRTVALAGLGEGAVEADLRPHRLCSQQRPGHAADPHRPGRMGAGGPHHHRAENVKNIQHGYQASLSIRNLSQRIIPL